MGRTSAARTVIGDDFVSRLSAAGCGSAGASKPMCWVYYPVLQKWGNEIWLREAGAILLLFWGSLIKIILHFPNARENPACGCTCNAWWRYSHLVEEKEGGRSSLGRGNSGHCNVPTDFPGQVRKSQGIPLYQNGLAPSFGFPFTGYGWVVFCLLSTTDLWEKEKKKNRKKNKFSF